ncbi:hypothetical protein HAX54_011625 [Datura stramonium]|uniref:Uncharacterized protein n=1 Tax=Datura stramonium TaxID=4076 RepID=A0ABS8TIE5_DATST|nr:hypothetical protein [Datura stramonium]
MADEAEIYDGARAQFPMSFGKQAKSQASLELVHNATRRTTRRYSNLRTQFKSKIIGYRPARLGSSNDKEEQEEEDGAIIGPPLPAVDAKTEEDEDGEMIGSRPPS